MWSKFQMDRLRNTGLRMLIKRQALDNVFVQCINLPQTFHAYSLHSQSYTTQFVDLKFGQYALHNTVSRPL